MQITIYLLTAIMPLEALPEETPIRQQQDFASPAVFGTTV